MILYLKRYKNKKGGGTRRNTHRISAFIWYMICPYRKQSLIVTETREEKEEKEIHTYREDYFEALCREEECGAWYNGKCNYGGGNEWLK